MESISSAVHEQCHDYCSTPAEARYNSLMGDYMRDKEWIYIGNGEHVEVILTDVFPSSEMISTIPNSLRSYRFDIYLSGDNSMASIQYGVYGLLDEFTAYCWDNFNEYRQTGIRQANGMRVGGSNSFLAYAEFRYYMLHYMLYAELHYPAVYQEILNNITFRRAFTIVDDLFAGIAEQQKSKYYIDDWNLLMAEMQKPEYVRIANLLKN